MITLFRQIERYRVERYKRLKTGHWSWVLIGHFNAGSMQEARALGRKALADKVSILRAMPVGREDGA